MGFKARLCRYHFPRAVANFAVRRKPASWGVVLMYHEVLPDQVTMPAWTIVKETDFHWQMNYLQSHFDVVTMEQALERVAEKREGRKPFAVVTFDDGYKGTLHTALPFMASMGLPFIVYVATQAIIENGLFWHDRIINLLNVSEDVRVTFTINGRVEHFRIPFREGVGRRWNATQRLLSRMKQMTPKERENIMKKVVADYRGGDWELAMLSPEDLNRLAGSDCVSVGSHTHGHELMDQLDPSEVRKTLQLARRHIVNMTGQAPEHFAYPNGNFNLQVLEQVQEEGLVTAVTTRPGYWSEGVNLLGIPRIGIGRFETRGGFIARVSGCL